MSVAQVKSDPPARPQAGLVAESVDGLLRAALAEDVGSGDVTTETALPAAARATGRLIARGEGVVAGLDVFARVFELLDPGARVVRRANDGDRVAAGDVVAEVTGGARALLTGERTALNFVQRMSGIATLTARYVELAAGRARVLDTRKTTPLLRVLEKYAVTCGGGHNHRFGLFDEAMIKDNHIDASGEAIDALCRRLRDGRPPLVITAEARDRTEALAAVAGGADVVLLDNMTPEAMEALVPELRAAASERERPLEIEASGGVSLATIARIAATGVDRVSVGALTHSAPALDLSLALEVTL